MDNFTGWSIVAITTATTMLIAVTFIVIAETRKDVAEECDTNEITMLDGVAYDCVRRQRDE